MSIITNKLPYNSFRCRFPVAPDLCWCVMCISRSSSMVGLMQLFDHTCNTSRPMQSYHNAYLTYFEVLKDTAAGRSFKPYRAYLAYTLPVIQPNDIICLKNELALYPLILMNGDNPSTPQPKVSTYRAHNSAITGGILFKTVKTATRY